MKLNLSRIAVAAVIAACGCFFPLSHADDKGEVECKMDFSLKGWSAFYNTAKGEGHVTCSNGQSLAVSIKLEGGGLTFGKSEIKNGTGKFSGVATVDDVLGSYADAEAHAGAVKSSTARVLTKGEVSLALAGAGSGWDLGVNFGKFTISKAGKK